VHIGARVGALAGPNDVLVSSTLRDLVIGSGLEFVERGRCARRVASLQAPGHAGLTAQVWPICVLGRRCEALELWAWVAVWRRARWLVGVTRALRI
jgi:hypothetical protein